MGTNKGKGSKKAGSSLTDAVVAALAKVDDKPAPAPAAAQDAPHGPNGFRNGPGSFADLTNRWAGGAPMAASSAPEPRISTGAPAPAPAPVEARTESKPAPEPPRVDSDERTLHDDDDPDQTHPEPLRASGAGAPPPAAVDPVDEEHPGLDEDVTIADDATVVEDSSADAAAADEDEDEDGDGPVAVNYFGRTDVGLVREHNEDNFLVADLKSDQRNPDSPQDGKVTPSGLVFAVCDGMGGAAAGEVASQMAVDTIFEVMNAEPVADDRDDFAHRLVASVEEAGQRIFSAAKMDRSRRGMGTTATVAGLVDNVLFVGQVGDSRAYVLRDGQFAQITKDQSLVNQLIEAGQLTEEEAEAFEHSNIILQALGTTEEVTVDLTFLEVRKGDRLMMCSDGLSGLVHGEMIKETLQTTEDKVEAAAKLIQMANAGGGHDNITVIVADFDGDGLSDDTSAPVRYQQYPLPPSNKRRHSIPPRTTSMKPGATKPGADVKLNGTAAGPSQDIEIPQQGGGGNNLMLIAALLGLMALGAIGAWLLWGGQGEAPADTPPPPQTTPTETTDPDPDENVEPIPEVEPPLAAPGSITITTDVEEGTLYVNQESRGPLEDGMTVELSPGGYTIEARVGETQIASQTITVTEGSAVDVQLTVPVGATEELPAPDAVDPQPSNTGAGHGGRGGGRGAGHGGSGRGGRGGSNGPLPNNPF